MRYRTGNKSGFTLVELLVVIAMIGILSTVAVPRFLNARKKALVDQGVAQVEALEASIELFKQLRSQTRQYDFSSDCYADATVASCELDFDGGETLFDYTIDVGSTKISYTIIAKGTGKLTGVELTKTRGMNEVIITGW